MRVESGAYDRGSEPSNRLSTLKAVRVIILLGSPARSNANGVGGRLLYELAGEPSRSG